MAEDSEEEGTAATVEGSDAFDTSERQLRALLDGSDLPDSAPRNVIGEIIADTYELEKELGAGGMGEVYLARHQRTGGEVALKLIKSTRLGDDSFVKRFELEAKHTAALNHPNIVRVFDYGHDDDLVYLAMEYVKGDPLDVLIRKEAGQGGLPLDMVVRLTEQILLALEAAHEEGLIHRDIKPPNILVSGHGTDQFVKVLDFGIARALEGDGADTQGAIGSPSSMAPEQFEGGEISPATDLYALGCTVHAMISGKPPFSGPYWKLATLHCVEPAPRLSGVPSDFADWVLNLLEKAPEDRPASCREALEALRAIDITAPAEPAGAEQVVEHTMSPEDTVPPPTTQPQSSPRGVQALVGVGIMGVAVAAALTTTATDDAPAPAVAPQTTTTTTGPSAPSALVERPLDAPTAERISGFTIELSPDGARLLSVVDGVIEIGDVAGGRKTAVPLPSGASAFGASWYPDGQRLLVAGRETADQEKPCLYQLADGELTELACRTSWGRVSPDGRRLAYAADRGVLVADADGSNAEVLDNASVESAGVRWLRDGSGVVFVTRDRKGHYELRLANKAGAHTLVDGLRLNNGRNSLEFALLPKGGLVWAQGPRLYQAWIDDGHELVGQQTLAESETFEFAEVSVSEDAHHLAYCRSTMQQDMQIASLDGLELGEPRMIAATSRGERSIAWSHDARTLYFNSQRTGRLRLYAYDLQDNEVTPLAPGVDWLIGASSIGATTAVASFELAKGGSARLVVVDGDTLRYPLGEEHQFEPTGTMASPPWRVDIQCSGTDATRCLLHQVSDTDHLFTRLNPQSGEQSEPILTIPIERDAHIDLRSWSWAPDDDLLAFFEDAGYVALYSTETGKLGKRIPLPDARVHYLRWDASTQGVFATTGDEPYRLLHLDLDGKVTIVVQSETDWISDPAPTPDGSHLAWTTMPYRCVPWLMDLPTENEDG